MRVRKDATGGVTTADVTVLAGVERVLEIARMLGGDDESAVSQAHARELLVQAEPVVETTVSERVPRVSRRR